jgi:hypothetical protein
MRVRNRPSPLVVWREGRLQLSIPVPSALSRDSAALLSFVCSRRCACGTRPYSIHDTTTLRAGSITFPQRLSCFAVTVITTLPSAELCEVSTTYRPLSAPSWNYMGVSFA